MALSIDLDLSFGPLDIHIGKRKSRSRSIDGFKSLLSKGSGMARAAKYEVEIIGPQNHPGGSDMGREIGLQCNAITMPGHNLEQQTARYGSAPAREMVTSHTYAGNITATFYLDENLDTKAWFDKWQQMAVRQDTHKARYYDDYIGTMNIYQLGGRGRTYGIKCDEVYPATIGPIEYAYESVDTIALLTVEFAYRTWAEIADGVSGITYADRIETFLGTSTEALRFVEGKGWV